MDREAVEMFQTIAKRLRTFCADEAGVSTTEFGIVIGLVALASVQALSLLGEEVEENLDNTGQTVAQSQADPFAKARGSGRSSSPNEPATAGSRMAEPDPESVAQPPRPVEPAFANSPPVGY